jgi:single-strand DNA-binding protein
VQDSIVTVVGHLAADPVLRRTDDGREFTRFRIGATRRRFDRATRQWVEHPTSWWNVTCWRALAANTAASLKRGDRVLVVGRPSIRDWQREDGRSGTSADIEADSVGHDLAWGTTSFTRVTRSERVELPGQADAEAADREVDARIEAQVQTRVEAEVATERARGLAEEGVDELTGELTGS